MTVKTNYGYNEQHFVFKPIVRPHCRTAGYACPERGIAHSAQNQFPLPALAWKPDVALPLHAAV